MNENLPSIRHLKYLAALAKYKSFSKAALSCNVTQSTLSTGIKELETLLESPLAIRTSRSVTLTPFGHDILKQSRKVLEEASYIMHLSKVAAQPMSGKVRLGIIPTIAPYWLPQALEKVQKAYPVLEIEFHENLTHELLKQTQEGGLDIAILALPYDIGTLKKKIFFKDYFSFVQSDQDKADHHKAISSTHIQYDDLLTLEDGHCLRDHVLAACKIKPKNSVEDSKFKLTSIDTLLELIRHGYGSTLLPDMIIKSKNLYEGIRIIPVNNPKPYREIAAVWRQGNPLEADIKELVKTLA